MHAETTPRLAYSIPDFMQAAGIGSRSTIYREISEGRLKTVKVGSRRLIPYDSAKEWLESLKEHAA